MDAYQLDRAATSAFLKWTRTEPFTPEEISAREEMRRCIKDLDEYGEQWIRKQNQ